MLKANVLRTLCSQILPFTCPKELTQMFDILALSSTALRVGVCWLHTQDKEVVSIPCLVSGVVQGEVCSEEAAGGWTNAHLLWKPEIFY